MAISTAATATAVVRPAINIIRRTRANNAACSGVGSGIAVPVMQGSGLEGSGLEGSALEKVSSSHQAAQSGAGQFTVTVAGDEGSVRLDRVLAVRVPELSRS